MPLFQVNRRMDADKAAQMAAATQEMEYRVDLFNRCVAQRPAAVACSHIC